MWITMTGVLVAFAGGIMIWFRIPFSPVKRRFRKDISGYGPQSAVIIGFLKTESDSRQYFRPSGNIPTGTSSILMGESVKYPMAEKTVFQNFYFQENMIWRAPFLVFFRQLCYSE